MLVIAPRFGASSIVVHLPPLHISVLAEVPVPLGETVCCRRLDTWTWPVDPNAPEIATVAADKANTTALTFIVPARNCHVRNIHTNN